MYVDGELRNTTDVSGFGSGTLDSWLCFGSDYHSTPLLLDGKIAEVRMWDDVRTGEEIAEYAGKTVTGEEEGLAHAWDFRDVEEPVYRNRVFPDLVQGGVDVQAVGYAEDPETIYAVNFDLGIAGEDNEPDHYWYYFQANGKALRNGDNAKVALKTVNGKKYAFDDEGKMLYGWVNEDNAERIDNTDGDGFKEGDYYFGGEDDGAMTTGWLQMDITYDEATADNDIAPVFNDDEDQSRWFYFQSNGKKVKASDGDAQKSKTINGKKYEFDQYGAMTAEWSIDVDKASKNDNRASNSTASSNGVDAQYAREWRYFNSVEDGARVSKGWFKVVPAENLNYDKYNDDEDSWYYADGSGNLYAGEFKTIKGKKYAFRNDGRMIDGLKFIRNTGDGLDVMASDDGTYNYDNEDDFDIHALDLEAMGYNCYYFGDSSDGAMKTNKTTVDIDGDKFNFYFQESGSMKGAGETGEKDDKYYQSGKLIKAGTDEKYQVVAKVLTTVEEDGTTKTGAGYQKLSDAEDFLGTLADRGALKLGVTEENIKALKDFGVNKDADDLKELYIMDYNADAPEGAFFLVNTSGKVIDSKSKNKDGNDYYYVVQKGGKIVAVYVED